MSSENYSGLFFILLLWIIVICNELFMVYIDVQIQKTSCTPSLVEVIVLPARFEIKGDKE